MQKNVMQGWLLCHNTQYYKIMIQYKYTYASESIVKVELCELYKEKKKLLWIPKRLKHTRLTIVYLSSKI